MARLTEKDKRAERDPRRHRVLPPAQIAGTQDADADALYRAYAQLESAHRSPCVPGTTPLIVHRMTVLGIANDLNYAVRAFALSNRRQSRGQLLLLPPARAPSYGRVQTNNRQRLVQGRDVDNAWHWFDGLPGAKLSDILAPSSCQELLQQDGRLRALDAATRNSTTAEAARALGLGDSLYDTANFVKAQAKGVTLADVPDAFRDYGMLWWWQAVCTYLVRVRGPLAARLQAHPAMVDLQSQLAAAKSASVATTIAQSDWLGAARAALQRATHDATPGSLGWLPPVAFDAALHVRMGDACGPKAKPNQDLVRKCVRTLKAALAPLLAFGVVPPGGRLFLATDSQHIVAEAAAAAPTLPFNIYHLNINRAKYDTSAWIELASAESRSESTILEETMLDLLLISRARYIAGSMYGNVPRLALQLRPTTPGDRRRLPYVTTDGRDWCTAVTCMQNSTNTGRFWR